MARKAICKYILETRIWLHRSIKVKNVWSYVPALLHSQFFSLYFSCCCPVSWGCCYCAAAIRTTLACRLASGYSLWRWGYVHDICRVTDRTGMSVVHSACIWQMWWDCHKQCWWSFTSFHVLSYATLFGLLSPENGSTRDPPKCLQLFTSWHDLVSQRSLTLRLLMSYIQGVPGGMWNTLGECSLC
jgi:hypothetical protein